jgi:hypothetical protein
LSIQTWSQNPSLKASLQQVLDTAIPIAETQYWRIFVAPIEETPSLVIHWRATVGKGAMHPDGLSSLIACLGKPLDRLMQDMPQKACFLVMASAGADVSAPFTSLTGINQLLETLLHVSKRYRLPLTGVLESPMGTYGGASLLLASTCDTLWAEDPADLHLIGKRR